MTAILNHLWQSTVFAAVAALLAIALRKNHARTRYWIWMAASLKFLIPFSLLVSIGSRVEWRSAPAIAAQPAVAIVMDEISQPFAPIDTKMSAAPSPHSVIPAVLIAVWIAGCAIVLVSWFRRWWRVRLTLRRASPVQLEFPIKVMSSPSLIEPGIFGIFRPVLLLPEGIADRLTPAQLQSILAHELCHVRRRDNLAAAIHMLVEATFWFHPLVWWIGARLIEERERACDEEVLRSGSEPGVYAESILQVCKFYLESPLECAAGVTGSDLKKRIESIMSGRFGRRLTPVRKLMLATAGVAAVAAPMMVGVLNAPTVRAQITQQSAPGPTPKWEVVSVRPCDSSQPQGRSGGGGGFSPGTLNVNCAIPMRLIEEAYGFLSNGRGPRYNHVSFSEAPAWLNSERYTIAAKSESPQGRAMMFGPMMQTLLEDRFKLKIRREIREVPAYNLTVAKGGPKSLKAAKEGSCIPLDFDHPPVPEPGKPMLKVCGMFGRRRVAEGERAFQDLGVTMTQLADGMSALLDRNVIDKTGLSGVFDIDVQVSIPDAPPRDSSTQEERAHDENDLVFVVVQKLGLKLESAKGPGEFYVIEHVERPTDNFERPIAAEQAPEKPGPKFEVVSIKPSRADVGDRELSTTTGRRLTASNATLKMLILLGYQVMPNQLSGGPDWLSIDGFDVEAKPANPDATPEQFREMVQAMLKDRFQLKTHIETKDLPIYELMVDKRGSKLQESKRNDPEATMRNNYGLVTGIRATMPMFAATLSKKLDRLVVDETGLKGAYTFKLAVTPEPVPGDDRPPPPGDHPSIFTALPEQLGLTLKAGKGPVQILVIDHAEKPTEN